MTLPVLRSKRKLEAEEEANEVAHDEMQVEGVENDEAQPAEAEEEEEEEVKPPIIKKPRKDIAEAAAKAAAEEKEKTSEADVPANPEANKEESKEGEAKEGEAKADIPPANDDTKETAAEVKMVQPSPVEETVKEPALGIKPEVEEEAAAAAGGVAAKEEDAPANDPNDAAAAPPAPIYKEVEYEEQDDGAEIPEEPDHVWNAYIVQLLLYKHQYRTLHVQATYDQHLHSWVDIQRKLYRRHKKDPTSVSGLTVKRLNALDAINFPFTLRGAAHWDRYFSKLQEFNTKHGHCLVPRLCEFAGLGDWVIDQRRQYKLMMQGKPSVLDPERQRKLEAIGFVWVVRNRPEWHNRYQELIQYREKYGDTKVPQHYKEIPGLGKWVAKQREQYRLLQQGKHSFLTPDRLEKLNDAGFVWSVRKDVAEDMTALAAKKKAAAVKKEEQGPTILDGHVKEEEAEQAKPKEGEPENAKEDDTEAKNEEEEGKHDDSMDAIRV